MNYQKELKVAKIAAAKAGDYLTKEFQKFERQQASHKSHHELVTKCDKQAEKIIIQTLKKNLAQVNFLSEEKGANNLVSDYLWVIDPLDGTNNFATHNPLFCVAIALLYKQEAVLSIIYVPILKEMFWATNKGSYLNGKKISVAEHSDYQELFVTYCHGKTLTDNKKAFKIYEHFHLHAHECRHLGSTSIELAMVACGRTDTLIVSGTSPWDVIPGICLVKNAGGVVTDWQGKAWDTKSYSVLASNKKLNPFLLKQLKKLKVA